MVFIPGFDCTGNSIAAAKVLNREGMRVDQVFDIGTPLSVGLPLQWSMFSATLRPGVELRMPEERHAAAIFAVVDRDREYLREWLPWVDSSQSEDDILAWIRATLEQFAGNKGFSAVIWVDGRVGGVIGIHPISWLSRKAEIGYWLASEFQGRGLITEACRAIIQHLLVELELHRVEIHCASGNVKSREIPKRLGFTHEGTLREAQLLNGRFVDLEMYSLLRNEFAGT